LKRPNIDPELIDPKALGKYKHEYTLKYGYFPMSKVYGGELVKPVNGKNFISKMRGVSASLHPWYIKMILNPRNDINIFKERWHREIANSTIMIKEHPFSLRLSAVKRDLIFNELGDLIATRPRLVIDGLLIKRDAIIRYSLPNPILNFILLPSSTILSCLPLPPSIITLLIWPIPDILYMPDPVLKALPPVIYSPAPYQPALPNPILNYPALPAPATLILNPINTFTHNFAKGIFIEDIHTNIETFYSSFRQAALTIGCNVSSISRYLKRPNPKPVKGKFILRLP
jgi:hypothetical protein